MNKQLTEIFEVCQLIDENTKHGTVLTYMGYKDMASVTVAKTKTAIDSLSQPQCMEDVETYHKELSKTIEWALDFNPNSGEEVSSILKMIKAFYDKSEKLN